MNSIRIPIAGIVCLAAFALVGWTNTPEPKADKDIKAVVQQIADAFKKGDKDEAKKLAEAAVADKMLIKRTNDFMGLFKTRRKEGFGIGDKPLANPAFDGIENALRELRKDVTMTWLKQADALEITGYRIAALSEVSLARGWTEAETGEKTKKAWTDHTEQMRDLGLAFAKAAAARNAKDIKTAADKLNTNCNRCHKIFKAGGG
jgi:hypothetical protein